MTTAAAMRRYTDREAERKRAEQCALTDQLAEAAGAGAGAVGGGVRAVRSSTASHAAAFPCDPPNQPTSRRAATTRVP